MKIREDLLGVVHVGGAVLRAGDDVPAGVTVGEHLTVTTAAADDPVIDPGVTVGEHLTVTPSRGASRETWAAYAASVGVEVTDEMTRAAIMAAVNSGD